MHINEILVFGQPSNVITPKLLKNDENWSVETAENVLTIGGSFASSFLSSPPKIILPFLSCNPTYGGQCPPCCSPPDFSPFLIEGVPIVPICKPYIFYKSDLLSTEKIITATLKPLIFSLKSVGIYGGRLQHLRKHNHHKPIPLLSDQAVSPTATTKCGNRINDNYDYTEVISAYIKQTAIIITTKGQYAAMWLFSACALCLRLVCIG